MTRRTLCFAAMFAALAAPAFADDVTDQIDEAKAAYAKHDMRATQTALNTASTLLRQQRLEQWKAVLPDAAAGWKAEDIEGAAAAMAVLGGGISVSRHYKHDSASVNIDIIAESPIVTSVSGLLNGLLTVGGAQLVVIDGRKVNFTKKENTYTALIADKALVTVKGQGGVSDDDLRAYLKAIKFAEIEALVK